MKSLDKYISERIIGRVELLEINPVPSDVKFIGRDGNGDKIFRFRIGKHRALYKIKETEKVILIIKIDKRSRVYRG